MHTKIKRMHSVPTHKNNPGGLADDMTHQGQATEELSPDVQRMISDARAAGRAEGKAEGKAEKEAELRPVMNALKETAAKARYLFFIKNSCHLQHMRMQSIYQL